MIAVCAILGVTLFIIGGKYLIKYENKKLLDNVYSQYKSVVEFFDDYSFRGYKCKVRLNPGGYSIYEGIIDFDGTPCHIYGNNISELRNHLVQRVDTYTYIKEGGKNKMPIDEFIKLSKQRLEDTCKKYDNRRLTTINELQGMKDLDNYYSTINETNMIANYILYRRLKQYEDKENI